MAQNNDSTSAALVFAGMMAALSDPAKATQQLAELQAKLEELEKAKAAVAAANAALDIRYGELNVKEKAIREADTKLAAANADLDKRTAALEEAEAKLEERTKKLTREVAAYRDAEKLTSDRAKAVEVYLKNRTDVLDADNAGLQAKAEQLSQHEQALLKREQDVAEAEAAHAQKVAALKSAIGA